MAFVEEKSNIKRIGSQSNSKAEVESASYVLESQNNDTERQND